MAETEDNRRKYSEVMSVIQNCDYKLDGIDVQDDADYSWYPQTPGYSYEMWDWKSEHIGLRYDGYCITVCVVLRSMELLSTKK